MRTLTTILSPALVVLCLATSVPAQNFEQEEARLHTVLEAQVSAMDATLNAALSRADAALDRTLNILATAYLDDTALNAAYDRAYTTHTQRVDAAYVVYNRQWDAAHTRHTSAIDALSQRIDAWEAGRAERERLAEEAEAQARLRKEQELAEQRRQEELAETRRREQLAAQEPGDFRLIHGSYCKSSICFIPAEEHELDIQPYTEDGERLPMTTVPLRGHAVDERGVDGGTISVVQRIGDDTSYLSWGYWARAQHGPLSHDHRMVPQYAAFAGGTHPALNIPPVLGTATYHGRMDGIASISQSGETWTKAFHDQYLRLDADFDANTIRGWGTLHLSQQGPWINRMMAHGYVNDYGQPLRPHWGRWGMSDISLTETGISPEGMFRGHGTGRSSHGEVFHDVKWRGRFYNPDPDPTQAPHAAGGGFSVNNEFGTGPGSPRVTVRVEGAFGTSKE